MRLTSWKTQRARFYPLGGHPWQAAKSLMWPRTCQNTSLHTPSLELVLANVAWG